MKLYISGPITGKEDLNRANFEETEDLLLQKGFSPVNPHKLPMDIPSQSWENYMRRDLKSLCDCDGIVMLDGWQKSRGAKLEFMLALELGLHIFLSPEEASAWGDILNY